MLKNKTAIEDDCFQITVIVVQLWGFLKRKVVLESFHD